MRKKILWISQLIMAVVLLIYALLSTQVFYDNLIDAARGDLKIYMNLFDENDYSLDQSGADGFSGQLSGLRVTFIDTEGNVLADSSKEDLGNHADREEVRLALSEGEGYAVRRSSSLGEDMIYYCRRFSPADGEDYLVRIAIPTSSEWQVFRDTLPTIGWFLLLDFLVCLLFTYLGTEYIISPVRRLAKDASLNLKLTTRYPELQPIVDVLNKRNSEVSEQFRELSEEKDLVEKAQRSKNDFIANVTHEMNTPLTSIRGYSELIASGALNEEQTKTAAETLVRQSDRLSKLAEETLDILTPDIDKRRISLEKEIEPDISVMSRHERLSEVLGNLIRNAIRYNKEGGSLHVGVRRMEDGHPRLIVSDTGIGIAEENLERIFDRFFTVDKSHSGKNGGFGLGLAVVKKICRRSGWGLRVESRLGEGTTFTVDFK